MSDEIVDQENDDDEMEEKLKGDSIGDTLYSEKWVLKTLMKLTQVFRKDVSNEMWLNWFEFLLYSAGPAQIFRERRLVGRTRRNPRKRFVSLVGHDLGPGCGHLSVQTRHCRSGQVHYSAQPSTSINGSDNLSNFDEISKFR